MPKDEEESTIFQPWIKLFYYAAIMFFFLPLITYLTSSLSSLLSKKCVFLFFVAQHPDPRRKCFCFKVFNYIHCSNCIVYCHWENTFIFSSKWTIESQGQPIHKAIWTAVFVNEIDFIWCSIGGLICFTVLIVLGFNFYCCGVPFYGELPLVYHWVVEWQGKNSLNDINNICTKQWVGWAVNWKGEVNICPPLPSSSLFLRASEKRTRSGAAPFCGNTGESSSEGAMGWQNIAISLFCSSGAA